MIHLRNTISHQNQPHDALLNQQPGEVSGLILGDLNQGLLSIDERPTEPA